MCNQYYYIIDLYAISYCLKNIIIKLKYLKYPLLFDPPKYPKLSLSAIATQQ